EHAFNGYPVLTEPAGSAAEELGAGCGRLGREQLGVGESAVVVDRDVEVLPAGAAAQVAGRGTENPFADGPEAAQLLDVDVHELPRAAALVAAHRAPLRTRKPRATVPAKHLPDSGGRKPQLARDDQRACVRVLARGEDALLELGREPPRLPLRHRRPIDQRPPAAFTEATPEPIAGRSARAPGGSRRLRPHPPDDQTNDP